jgi:hypothetical protein
MFRAPCAHRKEFKIVLYSLGYHHTYRWSFRAQVERVLSQPVHGTEMHGQQNIKLFAASVPRCQRLQCLAENRHVTSRNRTGVQRIVPVISM